MPLDDTGFRVWCEPLDKIDRVIDLLATEERWCRGRLMTTDGRRCIMGAIQAVEGTRVLTRPVSIAIRQVTGRRSGWWIDMDDIPRFNDDAATNHALVLRVLSQARKNIISRVAEDNAGATWRTRLSDLYRLLSMS